MRQVAVLSFAYLPQQGKTTEAETGMAGVEKGVHTGQAVGQDIHYRNGHQLFFKPKFHKLGICPGTGKKLHVFVFAGVVHAAAGMSGGHVFAIESKVFFLEGGFCYVCLDFGIRTLISA